MPDPAPDLLRVDVAVVGAGAAGLYTALAAARAGASVALVSRAPLAQTASYWAQGGISAALDPADTVERHLEDTLAAGRGAGRPSAARVLCEESPGRVRELEALGVRFDLGPDGNLALGLEGGHSARRVVHAGGSATGRRVTRELSARAALEGRITVLEGLTVSALWMLDGRCLGVVAGRNEGPGRAELGVLARGTVLATGGAAALWERTTNPRGAIGAGMSLALAAGARLADLELVQFHPTALSLPGPADGFLVTEAVRGEGATLHDRAGARFVNELAPRDEVARAVSAEIMGGRGPVTLDISGLDLGRFANVVATLRRAGVEPERDPVPVAPAAHYTMGGVATDLHGRSSLPGLLAVGECACTGLHGANRLASNSLAECVVFGARAGAAALDSPAPPSRRPGPPPIPGLAPTPPPGTRSALWRHAGLERDPKGLEALTDDPFPLASLVGRAGLARRESRGAHRRRDAPAPDPSLDGRHVVVGRDGLPAMETWA